MLCLVNHSAHIHSRICVHTGMNFLHYLRRTYLSPIFTSHCIRHNPRAKLVPGSFISTMIWMKGVTSACMLHIVLALTAAVCVLCQQGDQKGLIQDSRIVKIERMRRDWVGGKTKSSAALHGNGEGVSPTAQVASLRREAAAKMGAALSGIFQDTRDKQTAHLEAIRIARERMREMQAASQAQQKN